MGISIVEFPAVPSLDDDEVYVVKNKGLRYSTHKFHRYPGKFIPHVPRWAVTRHLNHRRGALVFDPFCGSGTTLVEAALLGHKAIGTDIDPIAALVSRVKTTAISEQDLQKCISTFEALLPRSSDDRFRPSIPTLSHWFSSEAIEDLCRIRAAMTYFESTSNIYDFLCVVFLAIVRRVSNADNQTQKTYVSHTHTKILEPAIPLFLETLFDYGERLRTFSLAVNLEQRVRVLRQDATSLVPLWEQERLEVPDLVVTSPPYLNSVDYVYNQMAEYFWTGDLFGLETQSKQNEFKRNYIGANKLSSRGKSLTATGIESVDTVVSLLAEKSPKNALTVNHYFRQMIEHLSTFSTVLRKGSHYVLVVGDSVVSGEAISTHELLRDCAEQLGFALQAEFAYEIRNRHMRFPRGKRGGIVKNDYVMDFALS